MLKKLTLVVGFGAGYVLGAKAGKERYEQIEEKFREIAGMPAVQSATANVMDTASEAAETAKQTLNDTAGKVSDKAKGAKGAKGATAEEVVVVDTGYGAAPMAGASASGTAPDITRP